MGKSAYIIGASRGIGLAIVSELAANGFDIYASSRNAQDLQSHAGEIARGAGRQFYALPFDVTDREAILAQYQQFFSESAPDVVVYNAGIVRDNLLAFMSPEEWDSVIRTNLEGFYNTIQPLIGQMMVQKHGRIIVISSLSGISGHAGQVNYSASKAALIGAAKSLAREVARKNILVNVVAPGVIATEMTKDLPEDLLKKQIPLQRFGTAGEVASVVRFLAGDDSSYITGQVISVNGGLYI